VLGQLPREPLCDTAQAGPRHRVRGVGPEHGNAGRLRVHALGMRAHHGAAEASGAAFVDVPEAVDDRAVADVVPTVRVAVEAADSEDHALRLRLGVVDRRDGVVDARRLHLSVVRVPAGLAAALSVGPPLPPGDHVRLASVAARRDIGGSAPGDLHVMHAP
jgi:hypothetical protein